MLEGLDGSRVMGAGVWHPDLPLPSEPGHLALF